jgi:hypothetical protein
LELASSVLVVEAYNPDEAATCATTQSGLVPAVVVIRLLMWSAVQLIHHVCSSRQGGDPFCGRGVAVLCSDFSALFYDSLLSFSTVIVWSKLLIFLPILIGFC